MMETGKFDSCDLSEIILNENTETETQDRKSLKRPKRVLHFSDGDLEEYSEDETDSSNINAAKTVDHIDPKSLTWIPWAWHHTTWIGGKMLDGCDCVGEWLASFFGITSPKYQFEINEFYRLRALENEAANRQSLEMGGWNENHKNNLVNAIP